MTDKIQKIREEVVGIINSINLFAPDEDGKNSSYEEGRLVVASQILQIIDSLQEEPVRGDFEMALAEIIDNAQKRVVEPWVVAAQWKDELVKLAKSEDPISEDLEEAAYYNCIDRLSKESIEDFKAGAEWQKEQMMKKQ